MDHRFDRLEQRIEVGFADMRNAMFRFNVAIIAGLLGVIAAILARGA
jgi:hypothetical protein